MTHQSEPAAPEILVVDDEAFLADSMSVLADSYGLSAITVGSLDEARVKMSEHEESLVLAFVDRVWDRAPTAGLDFVIESMRTHRHIRHVLMTAWPRKKIRVEDLLRIKNEGVELVDKVDLDFESFLPSELVRHAPDLLQHATLLAVDELKAKLEEADHSVINEPSTSSAREKLSASAVRVSCPCTHARKLVSRRRHEQLKTLPSRSTISGP